MVPLKSKVIGMRANLFLLINTQIHSFYGFYWCVTIARCVLQLQLQLPLPSHLDLYFVARPKSWLFFYLPLSWGMSLWLFRLQKTENRRQKKPMRRRKPVSQAQWVAITITPLPRNHFPSFPHQLSHSPLAPLHSPACLPYIMTCEICLRCGKFMRSELPLVRPCELPPRCVWSFGRYGSKLWLTQIIKTMRLLLKVKNGKLFNGWWHFITL